MRLVSLALAVAIAAVAACGIPAGRYPSDVQAAFARHPMRRLETGQLVLYYPDGRQALARRMAAHIEGCATELRRQARLDNHHAREKMVVVVPDEPFNNAYVLPPELGLADVAVIPAGNTLDFVTEFGLPPDPADVGCHEITHYVHVKQMAGLWGAMRTAFGDLITPQAGFDPWFFEGLATYYEAKLQPGIGRPRWPVFTGMFHAAYAGGRIGGGDLDAAKRLAPVGHHYLVGAMFFQFLGERYGEAALWRVIEDQASSTSIILSVNNRFDGVYGKSLGALVGEFRGWVAERFPVRTRPAGETVVRTLGDDARWAWGPGGVAAAIDEDVDVPTRLTVWDAHGRVIDRIGLVDLAPPRRLAMASPLLVSGMSFAADGSLWLTAVDLGATYQTTRLLRWRRGSGLHEVSHGQGPGGAIAPDGRTWYHLVVDGDRWSLAARDLAAGHSRVLWNAAPGQFALGVQVSSDGARLAVSAWDGGRWVVWVIDAATGGRLQELTGAGGGPVYDATFAPDGRVVMLDEVARLFQVVVVEADGSRRVVTDAPYGALQPRIAGDRLRFLARDGWHWSLDEVALPPALGPADAAAGTAAADAAVAAPGTTTGYAPDDAVTVVSDRPYSRLDGLFRPSLHTFAMTAPQGGGVQVGAGLAGGDRLDLVRWAIAGYYDPEDKKVSAAGGVILNDLAPWSIVLDADRYAFVHHPTDGADEDRELRDSDLLIGRVWRETYAFAAGATYAYDRVDDATLRLYGPEAHVGYAAVEATPYTGARKGVVLDASGAYFPRTTPITEGRAQLDVFAPLPWGRRHVLHATGRGHAILGVDELLAVGGVMSALPLYQSHDSPPDADVGVGILPRQRRFSEELRGFEDYPLRPTGRVAIADVSWRYPLIVDRGVPALWFLPAAFLSQLDLELFGAAAARAPEYLHGLHAAAGAAAILRFRFLRLPLTLEYQASRRLTDDHGWLQLLALGLDV